MFMDYCVTWSKVQVFSIGFGQRIGELPGSEQATCETLMVAFVPHPETMSIECPNVGLGIPRELCAVGSSVDEDPFDPNTLRVKPSRGFKQAPACLGDIDF